MEASAFNVPEGINKIDPGKFTHLESGMTICNNLKVPRPGLLTKWHFVAANPYIVGLHLAIFRKKKNSTSIYKVVSSNYLNGLRTPDKTKNDWIYHNVDPPVPVEAGDILGFYYDSFQTRYEYIAIATIRLPEQSLKPVAKACFVSLLDEYSLGKKGKEVDISEMAIDYRIPGLMATILPIEPTIEEDDSINIFSVSFDDSEYADYVEPYLEYSEDDDDNAAEDYSNNGEIIEVKPVQNYIAKASGSDHEKMLVEKFEPHLSPEKICMKTPTALQTCKEATMRAFYDYRFVKLGIVLK